MLPLATFLAQCERCDKADGSRDPQLWIAKWLLVALGLLIPDYAVATVILNTGPTVLIDGTTVSDVHSLINSNAISSNTSLSSDGVSATVFQNISFAPINQNIGTIMYNDGWQFSRQSTAVVEVSLTLQDFQDDASHYLFGSSNPITFALQWSGQTSGSYTYGILPTRVSIDGITLITDTPLTTDSFSGSATASLPAGSHDLAFEDFSNLGFFTLPDFDAQLTETLVFSISGPIFNIPEPPTLLSFFAAMVVFCGFYHCRSKQPENAPG